MMVSAIAVDAACRAQWEAERAGKNQYDAMESAIEAAVFAERERCAKIAEDYLSLSNIGINTYYNGRSLPAVIRAEPKEGE